MQFDSVCETLPFFDSGETVDAPTTECGDVRTEDIPVPNDPEPKQSTSAEFPRSPLGNTSPAARETHDPAAATVVSNDKATRSAVACRCSAPCGALHVDRPWRCGRKFLPRTLGGPTTSSSSSPLKQLCAQCREASLRLFTQSTDAADKQYRAPSPKSRPDVRRRAPSDQDLQKSGKPRKARKGQGVQPDHWATKERTCQCMAKCGAVHLGSSWKCGRIYTSPPQGERRTEEGNGDKNKYCEACRNALRDLFDAADGGDATTSSADLVCEDERKRRSSKKKSYTGLRELRTGVLRDSAATRANASQSPQRKRGRREVDETAWYREAGENGEAAVCQCRVICGANHVKSRWLCGRPLRHPLSDGSLPHPQGSSKTKHCWDCQNALFRSFTLLSPERPEM